MNILTNSARQNTPEKDFFRIKIDGKTKKISLSDLKNKDYRDELDNQIKTAKEVKVSLSNLYDWDESYRLDAFLFLAEHDKKVSYFQGKKKPSVSNLFDSVLSMMTGSDDLTKYEIGKIVSLEVAALMHPTALDGVCDKIANRMKELNVKGVTRRDLLSQAKTILCEVDQLLDNRREPDQETDIQKLFNEDSIPGGILVPPNWDLSTVGISRRGKEVSVPTPVVIVARQRDINDGVEYLTLAWNKDGGWKQRVVSRASIASARMIVEELAPCGVIVTSNTAKELVQYLADFESFNLANLPVSKVSCQLGWQGKDGTDGFLLGHQLITEETENEDVTNPKTTKQNICFRGADEGDNQIADSYRVNGTFDEWIETIDKVKHLPQIMLAVYSSLSAPLLKIFNTQNFLVSLAGRTSGGKTVALRVAASCWGDPNEQNPKSVLKTWSSTATWRERVPAILNNLPFLLDDTKHVVNKEDVAKTIYSVTQGVGKGRGTIKGLAKQNTWKTVAITSGEQPLTSFTEDGGTRSRVLSLWGSPFENTDATTGALVRDVDDNIKKHFGHAGAHFVQYFLNNRDKWEEWKHEYGEELCKFQEWAEEVKNPFAGRMATHFATIATTAWLANMALDLPWEYTDPIEPLWDQFVSEAGEANRGAAAMRSVIDFAYSNQNRFYGRIETHGSQPAQGWMGVWKKTVSVPGKKEKKECAIKFFPSMLKQLLGERGFEPESTIKMWKDEGWLSINESEDGAKRMTLKIRFGKENVLKNMICIKASAIDDAEC